MDPTLRRDIEQLHPVSFSWALACCAFRRDEAEDVLQTVYLKLFDGRARYLGGRSSLRTWLFIMLQAALCLLRRGEEVRALTRAYELLALIDSVRLSIDIFGERSSAVCDVYLDVWKSRSSARRQELVGALRQALAAMRRCTMRFPSTVPRALLWHGRLAFSQGAGRLAGAFCKKPPAVATGLPGELSRIFQLLARGLA